MSDADQNPTSALDPSDHELMRRLAVGERSPLAELVRRHQQRVLALAYRFLGRWDAAEDVCQDVFLRVFESAADYQPTAQFSTWLYRIVANRCWDQRRRATRDPLPLASVTSDPAENGDAQSAVGDSDRQVQIRAAIAALPDRQRLALILHRYEEKSHKEIAAVTGWSESAVESCLVRAYQNLRESLADLVDT